MFPSAFGMEADTSRVASEFVTAQLRISECTYQTGFFKMTT